MRKFALLGASALVIGLGLGVASARAQPSTEQLLAAGQGYGQTSTMNEGRAAAIVAPSADAFTWQQHRGR